MKAIRCAIVLIVFCLGRGSISDTIQTKSGETFKGRVIEETKEGLLLRTAYGDLNIPAGEVRSHARATYVVELADSTLVEGQVVGENEKDLLLKVGEEIRALPLADVKGISEKRVEPPPKKLDFRQIAELHQRALEFFKQKQYDKALAECEKILASEPNDFIALYNSACALSLLMQKDRAIDFLRRSIEAGYVDFAHMEQDTDLDNIRNEPGYKAILENKAAYIKSSTEKQVERITQSMQQRGVDVRRYKSVFDEKRNLVYLHTKTDEQLAAIREDLEDYAEYQWANLFQNRPQRPLYIVLLAQADSVKLFRGGIGGIYQAAINTLFCGEVPAFKLMNTSVVVHEFTHALHFADMFARKQQHPIWLVEGLATLFEASDRNGGVVPRHSYRLAIVQAAVKNRQSLPWKAFVQFQQPQFLRVAHLAYAQARYMLFYMHEKGLLKKFYDEYTNKQNYESDQSALEAFEVVFGKPIEAVEHDWKQWVLKQTVPSVPFLGVQTAEQNEQVRVTQVVAGSPAARAGIKVGDVVVSIDGAEVKSSSDLMEAIGSRKVGDEADLVILREGKEHSVTIKLEKRDMRTPVIPEPGSNAPYLGLTVEDKEGVVVAKEVAKGSPAEKAGIRPGEAILEMGNAKVTTVREFLAALRKMQPGQSVKIKIQQGDAEKVVTATLGRQP